MLLGGQVSEVPPLLLMSDCPQWKHQWRPYDSMGSVTAAGNSQESPGGLDSF